MQTARRSHHYEGSKGWGQSQPLKLDSVQDYIEAAYERRLAFRAIVDDFAKAAGCGVEVVAPCVKSEISANRKLWDRTSSSLGHPDMIGDYLRARVLVPANPGALGQFTAAMDKFIDHPLTVGYKDRIYRPNGSGFRALNGSMYVDGMNAELQIIPDDKYGRTRHINSITEGLRGTERAFREAEERFDMNSGGESMIKSMFKLVNKAEEAIGIIRNMRSTLHEIAADSSGVNALLDPEIAAKKKPLDGEALEKLYNQLARTRFGRQSAARLEVALQPLFSSAQPQRLLM